MNAFFEWLSNNPAATYTFTALFGALVISVVLLYLVAFFQGRDIAFWPPKIGEKPPQKAKAIVGKRLPDKPFDMDSQNHDQASLIDKAKVRELKDKILEGDFFPDLIVGVSTGGLIVAAILSKEFKEQTIPVISLWPHPEFDNPLNSITAVEYFKSKSNTTKIIIVDDFCRSGQTLVKAMKYVERSIEKSNFEIKTAAIFYYEGASSSQIEPNYYVVISRVAMQDFFDELEPFEASSQ